MLSLVLSSDDDSISDEGEEFSASIKINGSVITGRSCYNTGERNEEGKVRYKVDDGSSVWHDPADGAVVLAEKLLDTMKDPEVEFKRGV